ncbi:MAG: S8 family serine peptidase [Bacteroidetes bacterium]|nr:S8 family serine peptidase [Bacteroidota bacterium]
MSYLESGDHRYLPGRLVIKIKPAYRAQGLEVPEIQQVLAPLGVQSAARKFPREVPLVIKDTLRQQHWTDLSLVYAVHYLADTDPLEVALRLSCLPQVAYAEPEFVYEPFGEYNPNDPWAGGQWYIDRIQARRAWLLCKGDSNVVVGFTDTSFMWDHQDLFPSLRINRADIPWDGIDNDEDGYVDNTYGWDMVGSVPGLLQPDGDTRPWINPNTPGGMDHGTMVAGLGAARTDNAMGVTSPGFQCRFLPVKCSYDSNQGGNASILLGYDAVQYAASQGAHIINCSWGGTGYSLYAQDVIDYVTHNKNALVVAAGGNVVANRIHYPAGYAGVLGVAGTGSNDMIATSWGPHIDVLAPGASTTTHQSGGYWNSLVPYSSFASPLAAGCAALVRSYYPHFTAQQVLHCLRMGADDVSSLHTDPDIRANLGAGRINLYKSLTLQYPAISHHDLVVKDHQDEVFRAGDTLWLSGSLSNQLFPATNLTVTAISQSPWVTGLQNSQMLGQMASLSELPLADKGLSLRILPGVPVDHLAAITLRYQDGMYVAEERVYVLLNPGTLDLHSAGMQVTASRQGHWAYRQQAGTQPSGFGLSVFDKSFLSRGGMVLAQGTHVLQNMELAGPDSVSDFVLQGQLLRQPATNQYAARLTGSWQTHSPEPTAPNIRITQELYGFEQAPHERIIIGRQHLANPLGFHQQGLTFALYHNAGISTYLTQDTTGYDAAERLQYVMGYERLATGALVPRWLGVVWLETPDAAQPLMHSLPGWQLRPIPPAQLNNLLQTDVPREYGRDLQHFFGFRDMEIPAGGTRTLGFALVAGTTLSELKVQAQLAREKYRCLFFHQSLTLSLPDTLEGCQVVEVNASHPDAAAYLWQHTTSTAPRQELAETGQYHLRIVDTYGCLSDYTLNARVLPEPEPDIYLSGVELPLTAQGAELWFGEHSGRDYLTQWSFGDGYGYTGSSGSHLYTSPGVYTLNARVQQGPCVRTITQPIMVLAATGRTGQQASFCSLWPNPNTGAFTLQVAQWPAILRLRDAQGKEVWQTNLSQAETHLQLPVSLAPGLYHLQVEGRQQIWQQKISVLR